MFHAKKEKFKFSSASYHTHTQTVGIIEFKDNPQKFSFKFELRLQEQKDFAQQSTDKQMWWDSERGLKHFRAHLKLVNRKHLFSLFILDLQDLDRLVSKLTMSQDRGRERGWNVFNHSSPISFSCQPPYTISSQHLFSIFDVSCRSSRVLLMENSQNCDLNSVSLPFPS